MQSMFLINGVQFFQVPNAHFRILYFEIGIKFHVAFTRELTVLIERAIQTEFAAVDQTLCNLLEHALDRCKTHYVRRIRRKNAVKPVVDSQRLFNIQHYWGLDVDKISVLQPGAYAIVVGRQIAGLPGQPRHVAREKYRVLASA